MYKKMAIKLCGGLADKYSKYFKSIKLPLEKSRKNILFRTYVSIIIFSTLLVFLIGSVSIFLIFSFLKFPFIYALPGALIGGAFLASIAFTLIYSYPVQESKQRKRDINKNLPFAINHMSAIAISGVSPFVIFKLLASFGEYGEVSREAQKIVNNVDSFGQDITTSIKDVARDTASKEFKELLYGIVSIIETGGSLNRFLKVQAQESLFDYRLKREKYLENLSTYADIYTAVLIAAPLFLIAILAVMNMIPGGKLGGMELMPTCKEGYAFSILSIFSGKCGIGLTGLGIFFIIPLMNTGFILFVHLTQPEEV